VWLIFIGWFLNSAAEASRREMELRAIWLNVKVSSVMDAAPRRWRVVRNVEELVNEVYVKKGIKSAAVVEGGKLLGIVTLADIKKLAPAAWRTTPVSMVMTPQPLKTVNPGDNMKTRRTTNGGEWVEPAAGGGRRASGGYAQPRRLYQICAGPP
jgi:hypothetical protein